MSTAEGPRRTPPIRLFLLLGALFASFWLMGCGGGDNPRNAAPVEAAKVTAKANGEPLATADYKDKAEVKDKAMFKAVTTDTDKDKAAPNAVFADDGADAREVLHDVNALKGFDGRGQPAPLNENPRFFNPVGGEPPPPPADRPAPEKPPQVWHRDAARPTLARVYVGDGNSLELVSLHVTVTIEGPRARTVVDHVFRNPHDRQLGRHLRVSAADRRQPQLLRHVPGPDTRDAVPPRFARRGDALPLPADALARLQPDRLVKHVDTADWGRSRRAASSARTRPLETYEEIVRGRIDPALLEYAGGNTFRGRVFPIAAQGLQPRPPRLRGTAARRRRPDASTASRCPLQARRDAVHACKPTPRNAQRPGIPARRTPAKQEGGGRLHFHAYLEGRARPRARSSFACTPADPHVQAISGRQGDNGPRLPLCPPAAGPAPGRQGAAVRRPRRLPARHVAERAPRPLRRQHEAAAEDPGKRSGHQALQRADLQRRHRLGRAEGLAAQHRRRARAGARTGSTAWCWKGPPICRAALDKLVAPGFDVGAGHAARTCFLLSDGQITWGEPDVGRAGGSLRAALPVSRRASTATAPAWARRTSSCSTP